MAVLSLICGAARADNFVGGDWTTGNGYRGFDARGGADLDAKGDWEGDAEYAYAHSKLGTESRSNELILGAVHYINDNWSGRGSLTGWRDTINDVQYVGPSFGATYTGYSTDEGGDEANDRQSYRISLDSDFFFYRADATTSATTIVQRTRTIILPPQSGSVRLLQWHPYVRAEKSLGTDGRIIPWAELGHDFYSKNPSSIEDRAGQPLFAASANSLNGLVAGLLRNTARMGVDFKLPASARLTTALGVEQLAIDNSWATTQSVGLSQLYWDRLRLNVSWEHVIEEGISLHLWTAGLTLFF